MSRHLTFENQMTLENQCLCGSPLNYQQCCGLYHSGVKTPATAELLMRSRFSAYALHNADYLQASWDSNKRPKHIDFSKDTTQWLRLEIISVKKGQLNDEKGIVEFKAYYLLDGEESVMNEISRFKKVAGRWFYFDGVVKSIANVNQTNNQGKNALCSCGSGKKFKRCCSQS
jgi:SEC-C motif domain protein